MALEPDIVVVGRDDPRIALVVEVEGSSSGPDEALRAAVDECVLPALEIGSRSVYPDFEVRA